MLITKTFTQNNNIEKGFKRNTIKKVDDTLHVKESIFYVFKPRKPQINLSK